MRGLAFALLLLASCGGPPPAAAREERIACTGGLGVTALAAVCTVERRGDVLIVRKPDGGFRRFKVLAPIAGALVAADGAEHVRTTVYGNGATEIEVGGDRFVFPPDFNTQ